MSPRKLFDTPPPRITFAGNEFCLTGIFALGEREDVEGSIEKLGGHITERPSQKGCYIVVGTLPSPHWVTPGAGRKILTAIKLRAEGWPVRIVREDHFAEALVSYGATKNEEEEPDPLEHLAEMLKQPLPPTLECTALDSYWVVHQKENTRQWVVRFRGYYAYGVLTFLLMPYKAETHIRRGDAPLPESIRKSIVCRMREVAALPPYMPKKAKAPAPTLLPRYQGPVLTPEQTQQRNTARKAAMRAKPVTPEVAQAAERVITELKSDLPPGKLLQGKDRAKYYAVTLTPGGWLCRLHYKTKNRYVEVAGSAPVSVASFADIASFFPALREAVENYTQKSPHAGASKKPMR